ncbi:MAG: hypothetical protein K2N49_02795 [Ruminococcus sp.]|nr:hypothetical protein [Ruminococcus sp.]MDE7225774.1 hypothetical protein [Ruminococcus sp.]
MKKIICLIMLCCMMTGCIEEITEMPVSDEPESVPSEELYSGILESLRNMSDFSEYKGYVSADDAQSAVEKICREYPEFFWIDGYTVKSGQRKSSIEFELLNGVEAENLGDMRKKFSESADRVLNEISPELDDYEKIVSVHDYLINNTVYDHDGVESDGNGLWGTAYGCLVDGKAVCQGYSEAFKYIMDRLGIECGIVTGTAGTSDPYGDSGNSEPLPHAWNYVRLDGMYYWIDVTWDDPDDKVSGMPVMHTYCLIDDERIKRTRIFDSGQGFIPSCYSMDDNYYVRNGAYIKFCNDEAVSSAILSSPYSGEAELMFSDSDVYNKSLKMLFQDGGLWNIAESAGIGESVSYTTDDIMYTLKISY